MEMLLEKKEKKAKEENIKKLLRAGKTESNLFTV